MIIPASEKQSKVNLLSRKALEAQIEDVCNNWVRNIN